MFQMTYQKNLHVHALDASFFPNWKKNANDVVDDLFSAIQCIVAGTAIVSYKMIDQTCLECTLELPSNFPIITLQYKTESDNIFEVDQMTSLIFNKLNENSDIGNHNEETNYSFEEIQLTPAPLRIVKQIPLAILPNTTEVENKQLGLFISIEENEENTTVSKINICNKTVTDPIDFANPSSSVTKGKFLSSASHLDTAVLQPKQISKNSEDSILKEHSEEFMNANEINKKKGIATLMENFYYCNYCGKLFKSKKEKHWHSCSKPIAMSDNLLPSQNKSKHKDEPFTCYECGKFFIRRDHLARHQRIHTDEKSFRCSECGRTFTTLNRLLNHNRVHTGEKPFTCELCGKTYNELSSLSQHKRIHTGEKPFKCEECGKCFIKSDTLRRHKRIHTGEKPFTCEECGRAFIRRYLLTQHQKIHIGKNPFLCKDFDCDLQRLSQN